MKEEDQYKALVEMFQNGGNTPKTNDDILGIGKLGESLTTTDKVKLEFMTDLTDKDINIISLLLAVNKPLKCEVLDDFLYHKMRLKVSKNGKGRDQIIKMAQTFASSVQMLFNRQQNETSGISGAIDKIKGDG